MAKIRALEYLLARDDRPINITIVLEGDAAPIIRKAATESVNATIDLVRREPRVLRAKR